VPVPVVAVVVGEPARPVAPAVGAGTARAPKRKSAHLAARPRLQRKSSQEEAPRKKKHKSGGGCRTDGGKSDADAPLTFGTTVQERPGALGATRDPDPTGDIGHINVHRKLRERRATAAAAHR